MLIMIVINLHVSLQLRFPYYSESGHLGSYPSTYSNENMKFSAFLCLIEAPSSL